MFNLNSVQLIGNMTADPMSKSTQNNLPYCLFSIATNRTYKGKDGQETNTTQFHNCIAWRKLAEIIVKLSRKGHLIYIDGEIIYNEFDKDGVKQKKTEIVAHNFILLRDSRGQQVDSTPAQTGGQNNESQVEDLAF